MSHLESEIILAVFAHSAVVPCAAMHVSQHIILLQHPPHPTPPSFSPWGHQMMGVVNPSTPPFPAVAPF